MFRQKDSILKNEHALNREPVPLKVRITEKLLSAAPAPFVHHGFSWYIFLLYLHDCEMKFPNSNFYTELKPIPDYFFSFSFETCTARYWLNFPHDWSSLTTNFTLKYTNCPLAVKSISESRPFYFRFHAHNRDLKHRRRNGTTTPTGSEIFPREPSRHA